jgi:hypothetical protein
MNHLRSLIDALKRGSVATDPDIPAERVDAARKAIPILAEQAVCFYIGDVDEVGNLARIPELCRLPYPVCWFEAEVSMGDGMRVNIGLLAHEMDGEFRGTVFTTHRDFWTLDGSVAAANLGDDRHFTNAHADAVLMVNTIVAATKSFLSALHCSNVRRQEHTPDTKLQKARAKRGKAPLFSYWTLQLDGKSERGEDQGGTHASPRVHLRRGHPRQYAAGRWTWVQAHAVGNRSAGMVHKDYSAGPALVAAAR